MKKKIISLVESCREWRRLHLFTTPTETNALVEASMKAGSEIQKHLLKSERDKANEAEKRARELFLELQKIKVRVDGNVQVLEINLVLSYKSLRLVDVTTAAEVLAQKTEKIYRDHLTKRLGKGDCTCHREKDGLIPMICPVHGKDVDTKKRR